jgi:hypothetical protein
LPRWATVLDIVAVGALLSALVAALGGDLRLSVGSLRLTISSPFRPVIVGIAVFIIRHAVVREQALPNRIATLLRRLETLEAWSTAWRPFLITRSAVLLVGLLAVYTVGYPPGAPPYRVARREIINLPLRWDAGWYMGIATYGYRWDRAHPERQQNVAFFPAYPLLTSLLGRALGNSLVSHLVAAVMVSHVAFLWSLVYLYQLARDKLDDAESSARAVLLLATYPFSVFHGAVYTESVFLLGCLGSILNFSRGRWLQAALWGTLVGLSRPNGFLLTATLVALAYTRPMTGARSVRSRTQLIRLLAVVAPVAGTALFSCYIAALTGNPFQWSAQHAAWGRVYRGAAPFLDPALQVAQYGFESYLARIPYDFLNGAAALFAVLLIVPVWRRVGPAYAIFLCSNLLPPLVLGGVMSLGRLTSTMFPLFIWLGLKTGASSLPFWVIAFTAGQSLATVLFYTWRPLF